MKNFDIKKIIKLAIRCYEPKGNKSNLDFYTKLLALLSEYELLGGNKEVSKELKKAVYYCCFANVDWQEDNDLIQIEEPEYSIDDLFDIANQL